MMVNFVKAVGYKFVISDQGSHMSASVFGTDATTVFALDKATTQNDFLLVADDIPYLGDAEANIDLALQTVASEVFTLEGFSRQKVPKVLVLLTASDCSTCIEPLTDAVRELKENGVHIITIPIGDMPNQADMDAISSLPLSQYVNPQKTFNELINGVFIQKISSMVCSGKPGICEEPPLSGNCENIVYNCDVDVDCPTNRKCCLKNCEQTCSEPVTGKFNILEFLSLWILDAPNMKSRLLCPYKYMQSSLHLLSSFFETLKTFSTFILTLLLLLNFSMYRTNRFGFRLRDNSSR